jgi:Mor family transcriptional regulator
MALPAELKSSECPLLRDAAGLKASELIEQFNALLTQVREVADGQFSYLLNRPDVQSIVDDLGRVRGQLTRPRYRVGFLGTSQAGKSTTFNNVLQEEIAQSGIGEATTSVITRFRRIEGRANKFTLHYLTQEQYLERRERLCKALMILNAGSKSNAEILSYLSDPKKVMAGPAAEGDETLRPRRDRTGDRTLLPDDIPYLRDFLRAYDAHGERFVSKTGQAREVDAPFERRADYINHAPDSAGTPTENVLLFAAEIGTPNQNIPPQLEAIDCPGLGSKRTVDTVMTKEFLPHLDGALIFLRADQLRSKDVVEILEVLKTNFGKLEGRVWIVVNKFDVLTKEPLYGDANGQTVFDLIRQFNLDYGIPAEQIVFTSKRIHELPKDTSGKVSPERAAERLGVPAADPIPPRCRMDRVLAAAFQHLLDDGGIEHLRRLILETVSDSVSGQISAAAKREMVSLRDELIHKVETEQRRVKGGRQQLQDAILCHDTVQELLLELATRTEFFRPLADHLQQKLLEKLLPNEQRQRVIEHMPVFDLAKQFQLHAKLMDEELDDLMNADVIDRLYGEVGEKLYGLPQVPILRAAGPHDAWQDLRKKDRDNKSWRGAGFPTFRSEELFAGLANTEVFSGFDGEAYLTLMKEKIRVAVQQVMHAVRVQMRRRLKSLERELSLLIYKPENQ